MKTFRTLQKLGIACLFIALASACSKNDDSGTPTGSNNGGNNTPTPDWTDSISRDWKVTAATHKGSPDNSSKGLELNIRSDGSYTLVSTGFVGTWEFMDNYTKVLLDKNNSQFKTTWTINKLSSQRLEVDFKSPFTGGSSHWDMDAQ